MTFGQPPTATYFGCHRGCWHGGLAAAATLRRSGFDVQIYEQASRFERIGAGIQMMPNSMKVLRELGVEKALRGRVFGPESHLNREWSTGKVLRELPMPEELFGAPYLCMHRADLTTALVSAIPKDIVNFKKKLVGLKSTTGGMELVFEDGTHYQADVVVGADGVHSVVREIIIGPDEPIHKGRIAYRAVYDSERLNGRDLGPSRVKWWGIDRHIVIYYVTKDRGQIYFVTSVPESAEWLTPESWSAKGDVRELCEAYKDFHSDVELC